MTTTETEIAQRTLEQLLAKRDALATRKAELSIDRRQIAYDAQTGDAAARKKLDKLNAEAAIHTSEAESVDAAIVVATAKLETARQAEAVAADQGRARELRDELVNFREHAARFDAALATMVQESLAISAARTKMSALGASFPSQQQLDVNAALVISTSLMLTPWGREFRFLAPHEKRTWSALLGGLGANPGWSSIIETNIARRLGEDQKSEAA